MSAGASLLQAPTAKARATMRHRHAGNEPCRHPGAQTVTQVTRPTVPRVAEEALTPLRFASLPRVAQPTSALRGGGHGAN